ncbi:MAG: hypothetical protein ABFD89_09285 [Bryobacteraceae bacterium]
MKWSIGLLMLSVVAGITNGQTPLTIDAEAVITSARPLDDAADMLEHKFGWVITYEDPVWSFAGEVVDLVPVRKPGTRRFLAPRPGQLPIGALLSTAGERPDKGSLVSKIIQAHDDAGNPGSFKIVSDGDFLHLIPTFAKGVGGGREAVSPLLDTPIHTPIDETTPSLAIRQIIDEVSRTRGIQIDIDMSWRSDQIVFGPLRTRVDATGQPARSLLLKILKEANRPLTWRLLCEPSLPDHQGFCALTLRSMHVYLTDDSGNVVVRPLR